MEALKQRAKELLEQGEVKAVLGYAKGTGPSVARSLSVKQGRADALVLDARLHAEPRCLCDQAGGEALGEGWPWSPSLRLSALCCSSWLNVSCGMGKLLVLATDGSGSPGNHQCFRLEEHLALKATELDPKDKAMLERLQAMTREERWGFWQKELSRCMKCYACRNSCPMCYCEHCTMDCNRPQWVPVASHALGIWNTTWSGPCTWRASLRECGECGRACPVGIPVHLLTLRRSDHPRAVWATGRAEGEAGLRALHLQDRRQRILHSVGRNGKYFQTLPRIAVQASSARSGKDGRRLLAPVDSDGRVELNEVEVLPRWPRTTCRRSSPPRRSSSPRWNGC